MSKPREILPGRSYLVTRRCTQRQYLLRPDKTTNAVFSYCLGEAAKRHEIELIAWIAMSNHYHAVVHDPQGRLPAFLEQFHKMLAKALNARWERFENLWSSQETCVTLLPTPEDVFDKVIYVLANPVSAHLVDRVADWPGCSSLNHLAGGRTRHERPHFFFSVGGTMPAAVDLHASSPPSSRDTLSSGTRESHAAWVARVRAALEKAEQQTRRERLRAGAPIMGRKAVRAMSAFDRPTTPMSRSPLRPAVAGKDPATRFAELAKLVAFRIWYARARTCFANGDRSVEFPPGTYRMRILGVHCAPFPACSPGGPNGPPAQQTPLSGPPT